MNSYLSNESEKVIQFVTEFLAGFVERFFIFKRLRNFEIKLSFRKKSLSSLKNPTQWKWFSAIFQYGLIRICNFISKLLPIFHELFFSIHFIVSFVCNWVILRYFRFLNLWLRLNVRCVNYWKVFVAGVRFK